MDVRVEKRFDTAEELVLDVEVKKQAVDTFLQQGYEIVAAQRGVQAAAGETLKEACERVLSQKTVAELLTNVVMNMSYPFARSEADDVVTVGSPLFTFHDDLVDGEPFRYTARWAKLPQAELSSYDPVHIVAPARQSSDEVVDAQVARLLEAQARYEACGEARPIEMGDAVSLALCVTLQGDEVEGLCFDERTYTTGIGTMPEDFERNIIGMVPSEEKAFDFEGIADFDADDNPIMKTYHADAKVKSLLRKVTPTMSDEWVAANVPACKTVDELKSLIRKQVDAQLEDEYRHYLNYIAASELAKRFSEPIPDVAYEAMRDEIQAQFDREAAELGLTREEYMREQGANEQQYSVRMILQVRERLAQSIALDALARHLGLEVGEADLDEFFKASAPMGAAAEMRRQMEDSGRMYMAYEGARRLKANDYLVAHALVAEE